MRSAAASSGSVVAGAVVWAAGMLTPLGYAPPRGRGRPGGGGLTGVGGGLTWLASHLAPRAARAVVSCPRCRFPHALRIAVEDVVAVIDNNGTPEQTVQQILEVLA